MLLEEIKKLQKMRRTLKNAIDAVGTALSTECGVPWLEECPEEWYIATPAQGDVLVLRDIVRSIQDHISYCDSHGLGEELSVGSIVIKDSLLQGGFQRELLLHAPAHLSQAQPGCIPPPLPKTRRALCLYSA